MPRTRPWARAIMAHMRGIAEELGAGFLSELLQQVGKGAALEEPRELRIVATAVADPCQLDGLDCAAVLHAIELVLDADLRALVHGHGGEHGGVVAVRLLALVLDELASVLLDLA